MSSHSRPIKTRRAWWPQAVVLIAGGLLPIMAVASFAPAVPTMLAHFSAVPNAQLLVPLMISAPGLVVALLAPVAGQLTDRFGRRRLLVFSSFLYALFGALPFFIIRLGDMFFLRLGIGLAEAFILTIVNTLIADYFTDRGRRILLTAQAIVAPIFGSLIVIVSGLLTSIVWNGAFLIYTLAIPIFLGMLFLIFEPDRKINVHTRGQIPFVDFARSCAGFSTATFLISIIFFVFGIQGARAFDAIGISSPQKVGYLVALANIGLPLGGLLLAALKKQSYRVLVLVVFALNGFGTLMMGLAHHQFAMTTAAIVQEIGGGMTVSTTILWAQSVLPAEWRGRGMGVWCSSFFLGQFLSPFAFSIATSATGSVLIAFQLLGAVTLGLAVVWGVLFLLSSRKPMVPA